MHGLLLNFTGIFALSTSASVHHETDSQSAQLRRVGEDPEHLKGATVREMEWHNLGLRISQTLHCHVRAFSHKRTEF